MNALELTSSLHDLSPSPVLTGLKHGRGFTTVVRDDLLPGGTKQRASAPFILEMIDRGYNHFVYASPFAGFAQVALSYVCQILGVRCTIVCENDKRFSDQRFHPFSAMAGSYGAKLIMVNSLSEAEFYAESISIHQNRALKIPLGFDCNEFRNHLIRNITKAFAEIEKEAGKIRTIWMPVGSGTLVRSFLEALPSRVKFNCVNVRVLEPTDKRIQSIRQNPAVRFFDASMSFHTEADDYPTIPSNAFYDAKLWSFIKQYGEDGDLWWNVAR